MKKQLLALAVVAATTIPAAHAERYFADNSISVLMGGDFKIDSADWPQTDKDYGLTTYTVEHVSGYSWGGLFFFMDRDQGDDQFRASYSEFSPKFFLTTFDDSIVKNINLAFTLESGSTSSGFSQDNYLYGIGADLAIPGMNFASATYYYCKNDNDTESDHQITLTYGASWGQVDLGGYIDYSTGAEDHKASFNFNPQLTYNVGPMLGYDNKIKLGIEYSAWHNKYGTEFDENTVSALIKVHM
ncbi:MULTISPECIES: hypothetical protein [Oceanospirillaceae]|jgi:nucleoside-specific outer membrane channel protein Tsx|uniref:Nucleoside-specific outer membrane channel protein Tsx n=1 Tax=Oceanobacter antarcticus TaxID=3133425 RepID=A0ABW8NIP0_9GAMM|tara:strand:+ start:1311 stop:2039 length:729 start_codon:yes stop_codon:yes gene_type:complete